MLAEGAARPASGALCSFLLGGAGVAGRTSLVALPAWRMLPGGARGAGSSQATE